MAFYDHIKNERLRELVMASESIASLPPEQAQVMINNIAMLPEDGQKAMIETLEQEQRDIAEARKKNEASPEAVQIEANSVKLTEISHDFDRAMREAQEGGEREVTLTEADALLKNI